MTSAISRMNQTFAFVVQGVSVTLEYTFLSAIIGFFLGLCLALLRIRKRSIGCAFAKMYISVFRGTPMLLQLSIIYFGIPSLTGYMISPLFAGVVAFSLNSAAYVSEVIRSGIESIDVGQLEAARALNIPEILIMKDIILPQAIQNVLPALVNEMINLLKETALISTLGVEDIMRRSQLVAAENYTYFEPLMMAAVCYYGIVVLMTSLAKKLEKRDVYARS